MTDTATLERNATDAAPRPRALARVKDDSTLLKAAANLTRDLNQPNAVIYWGDMLGSAVLGYAALFGAMAARSTPLAILAGIVAIVALFRAGSFIHELTHIKKGAIKSFRFTWNLIVGVPLLIPSFMYEGVHNQHHAKTYYGTADDPEYLPLALMRPWTLPLFLIAAALAPVGMLVRFAILAPLSLFWPRLRALVVGRYSGLQINPKFVRPPPEGEFARLGVAGGRVQRLGDRAHRPDRDRRHSAPRFPDLPRCHVGRDAAQPGTNPGRASVGE
jgi:hypothetical protein